jgi:hypothetical protein
MWRVVGAGFGGLSQGGWAMVFETSACCADRARGPALAASPRLSRVVGE